MSASSSVTDWELRSGRNTATDSLRDTDSVTDWELRSGRNVSATLTIPALTPMPTLTDANVLTDVFQLLVRPQLES